MKRIAVFGYGAVGRELTAALVARGDSVVVAQRKEPALPAGVRFAACDVTDAESVRAVCADGEIVVCTVGLPYRSDVWERSWPQIMHAFIGACEAAGARFIFVDNLYLVGPVRAPITEETPLTAYGRKPRVRAQITRLWQEANARGRMRAAAVRASDFYGPDVETSILSAFGVARLVAGQPALIPYNPDHPHDFTYVPDIARAVVAVADAPDDAYGQGWNVPNAPTRTLRELLVLAASIAGVPPRIQVIPAWLLPLLGIFMPDLRELVEMRFQSDRPYHVDSSKFVARFGMTVTSFEEGLAATVAFYRKAREAKVAPS